jgi:glycosyltransferase involved in cell wall biosynthesis
VTRTWHILTGEYPPQPGGVSDYVGLLAAGMGHAGLDIHVWAPPGDGATSVATNVTVHRCAGTWSARDLRRLSSEMDSLGPPGRLLVQYAPNAWGRRGLNVAFCRWLEERRATGYDVRLMIHEPFYPWRLRDRPQRWILAGVQRLMMRIAVRAAARVYLSTQSWEPMLRPYQGSLRQPMTWLPVPSTIPVFPAPDRTEAIRQGLVAHGGVILGSFGTFSPLIRGMLRRALPVLLASRKDRACLLLGRNSEQFALELVARHPELAGRVVGRGGLAAKELSAHLQACDVLVQPYPDGVSTRRTSLMAALAHGVAAVTTLGFLSDSMWAESGCAVLVPASDPGGMIRAAESLLADPEARARLRAKAQEVYREQFDLENTIRELLRS